MNPDKMADYITQHGHIIRSVPGVGWEFANKDGETGILAETLEQLVESVARHLFPELNRIYMVAWTYHSAMYATGGVRIQALSQNDAVEKVLDDVCRRHPEYRRSLLHVQSVMLVPE